MQRIFDLSNSEILNLTDEHVQKYIDVECLLQGVPLVPTEAPVEPKVPKPEPDTLIYSVGGVEFYDEVQAAQVLNILRRSDLASKKYQSAHGETFYSVEPLGEYSHPTLKSEKVFSPEYWEEVQKQAEEYGRSMVQYRDAKKAYDTAKNNVREIEKDVWIYVSQIRADHAERQRLIREFDRYVHLADGDRVTAWKFFSEAHADAEEHEGLKEELGVVDVEENPFAEFSYEAYDANEPGKA